LREYAGIEKEVVSVGVNTKVEIWSKERYATMETGFEEMDDIMEQLSEMGIQL
jgi:MraZ protein